MSSPLLGGGGCNAVAPAAHVPTGANGSEHYTIGDDSDTSDDESDDEDRHPDPHPADPDMAGWPSHQIGCYVYANYTRYQQKGRNYQGARKPPGRRLARSRARAGHCDDGQLLRLLADSAVGTRVAETANR